MSATAPETARHRRMKVLAHAAPRQLSERWTELELDPAFEPLRGPETGLATVRGRISGDGAPFNVGDITVTRATVRLNDGAVGHGWRLGRDKPAAQLAAVIDALCHDQALLARIEQVMIGPLERQQAEADRKRDAEAATTKVDFFTLVRGED